MKNSRAFRYCSRLLLVLCLFNGIGALFGGVGGMVAPEFFGSSQLVPILHELPFIGPYINTLVIPASTLLLFIFVPQSVAATLLLRKHPGQFIAVIICGILLVAFTAVELIVIPNPLSWVYLFIGVVEIVIAIVCLKIPSKT